MTRHETSLDPSYFETLYAADPDPWRFATSAYEREKYAATLAALPQPRFRHGLEIGCSIGILTRQIARRCETLIALDVAASALDQARKTCGDLPNVDFVQGHVPADWPDGVFDLVLLSEVVYYLDADDVGRLVDRVRTSVSKDGVIILVHWLGETNYPLTGDEAADLFIKSSATFTALTHQTGTEDYRLDILKVSGPVASGTESRTEL